VRSPLYNVGGWLARRARTAGDRPALVEAGRSLDYASLEERTARCAGALAAQGVERGDRVALLLGNRSAYLEVVFGAARLGAIAVPVNARLTAPEVRRVLADCAPRVLVHEADASDVAAGACDGLEAPPGLLSSDAYEEWLAAAAPREQIEPVSPDDPMILMYTSGTTGVPKGALLPHRKTLFNSLNAQLFFDLTGRDRVLVALPLFHSFGLLILAVPTLYAGGTIFLEKRFDAAAVWDTVSRHGIHFFGGVPTQFRELLEVLGEAPEGRYDLSSLRFLFTAGSAIPVETVRAYQERGLILKQGFGQTETSILCCLEARDALRKAGSVGRPVFHAEIRVVAIDSFDLEPHAWRPVEPGETGEIVVRGPITMLGYWNQPAATAETLRGDWLRTGDLATVDDEGFLTLVGRARQMYISGGENVYPAEIEAVYAEHPSVDEVAVVGVPDEKWGEVGWAYVVLAPDRKLEPEALLAWGGERLARFKLPARFLAIDALPRTETGKVQKQRLLESGDTQGGRPESRPTRSEAP
jgi:fatty-acyl-CoA synthase